MVVEGFVDGLPLLFVDEGCGVVDGRVLPAFALRGPRVVVKAPAVAVATVVAGPDADTPPGGNAGGKLSDGVSLITASSSRTVDPNRVVLGGNGAGICGCDTIVSVGGVEDVVSATAIDELRTGSR